MMYYRTPDDRRRVPYPPVSYPSDGVTVPDNYGGNVFRTDGGRTTFSPLEEQVTLPEETDVSAGEVSDGDGGNDPVRANEREEFPRSDFPARADRENSGDSGDSGDSEDSGNRKNDGNGERRDSGTGEEEGNDDGGACVDAPPDATTVGCFRSREDDGNPYSLPTPPAFSEQFKLPHSLGSEELLLLGMMYLTSQKPGDDLWVYLLVLLLCG